MAIFDSYVSLPEGKQDPTFKIVQNHFPPLYTEIGSSKARCKSTACEAADSRWHTRSSASSSAVSLRFLGVGTHGRAKGWTWVCWTNVEHIPHIPYKIAVEYGKLATNNDVNLNDRELMGGSPWILMDSLVPYFHPNTHMGLHHFSRVYPRHGGGALFAWWISDGFQGFQSLLNILQDVFLQRASKTMCFFHFDVPGFQKNYGTKLPNLDRWDPTVQVSHWLGHALAASSQSVPGSKAIVEDSSVWQNRL